MVAQAVKNPPAMQDQQEMQVQSLGQENPWRRKWQPTPVSLPEESKGQGSLGPWGLKELDLTEVT